jgi:hypothetical protein
VRCQLAALALWLLVGVGAEACSPHSPARNADRPADVAPSPLPGPGNARWPNEPAGLTVLTDWDLDQAVPAAADATIAGSGGWRVAYDLSPGLTRGWAERTGDPGAPLSPPGVYDFVFPAGMVEGHSPATVYYRLAASEVYAGFWWKPSAAFDLGPNGNKIAFLSNGGGDAGGQQFLILRRDGLLHVLPEYPGDFRWRGPEVNPTPVALGEWHRIEWYVQLSSGTLKWWLDGRLQGSYTDVRNQVRFDMFQLNPTWGGNTGARKRQTDHYWFDHVRVSARTNP